MMKDSLNVEGEQSFTLAPLVSRTPPSVTLSMCTPVSLSPSPLLPFSSSFLSSLLLNGNIIIEDSTS